MRDVATFMDLNKAARTEYLFHKIYISSLGLRFKRVNKPLAPQYCQLSTIGRYNGAMLAHQSSELVIQLKTMYRIK